MLPSPLHRNSQHRPEARSRSEFSMALRPEDRTLLCFGGLSARSVLRSGDRRIERRTDRFSDRSSERSPSRPIGPPSGPPIGGASGQSSDRSSVWSSVRSSELASRERWWNCRAVRKPRRYPEFPDDPPKLFGAMMGECVVPLFISACIIQLVVDNVGCSVDTWADITRGGPQRRAAAVGTNSTAHSLSLVPSYT